MPPPSVYNTALIPKSHLAHLREYAYCGTDASLIAKYIMQPYWSACARRVPLFVAPNAITLLGFACAALSTAAVVATSVWGGGGPWTWVLAAVMLHTYSTLDCCDGKHARRTGCQGPLGELVDHGCDAFITPMLQFSVCTALGLPANLAAEVTMTVGGLFWVGIWDQHLTGALNLPIINGPTEGILILIGIFLTTAANGTDFWARTDIVPPITLGGVGVTCPREALLWFMRLSGAATALHSVAHVARSGQTNLRTAARTAAVPLALTAWCVVLVAADAAPRAPWALPLLYAYFCAYDATRLTLCRLCRMRSPMLDSSVLCIVPSLVIGSVAVVQSAPTVAAVAHTAGAVAIVLRYLQMVCTTFPQIAAYLGIHILTMTAAQRRRAVELDSAANAQRK